MLFCPFLLFADAVRMACTGVLPFAKRGDNRTNNLIRLQQMFPRIVAAEFHIPSHISATCRDLLTRMLTADPASRISVAEVSWPCCIMAIGLMGCVAWGWQVRWSAHLQRTAACHPSKHGLLHGSLPVPAG